MLLLAMSWQFIPEPQVRVLSLCKAQGKVEAWMGRSRRQHAEQAGALPLSLQMGMCVKLLPSLGLGSFLRAEGSTFISLDLQLIAFPEGYDCKNKRRRD